MKLQMSYTEYLRRKAAIAPVVLDVRPKMDASTYTRHVRVTSAVGSYQPTKSVVGNIDDMNPGILRSNGVTPRTQVTTGIGSGGAVPDASTYTDFAAGKAAAADYKSGPPIGKLVLNGSLTGMTSVSNCSPEITLATAAKTGSQAARDAIACHQIKGEQHSTSDEISSKPVFIDDTISLNTGTFRIGTGSFGTTGSTKESSNAANCINANHTPSAIKPRASWSARPTKGAGGIPVSVQPNPSDARKVGGLVPSDHIKYVEAHHGNDGNVNPRRIPTKFQIPAGSPAHLKINDPKKVV